MLGAVRTVRSDQKESSSRAQRSTVHQQTARYVAVLALLLSGSFMYPAAVSAKVLPAHEQSGPVETQAARSDRSLALKTVADEASRVGRKILTYLGFGAKDSRSNGSRSIRDQANSRSGVPALPELPSRTSFGGPAVSKELSSSRSPAQEDQPAQSLFPTSRLGVVQVAIGSKDEVTPSLRLSRESAIRSDQFALSDELENEVAALTASLRMTPPLVDADLFKKSLAVTVPSPELSVRSLNYQVETDPFDRSAFIAASINYLKEKPFELSQFKPLTEEEYRFLSGLLLYQNGFQCGAAVGLFHSVAHKPEWQAEADYHLAMCSKKLGLMTDFSDRVQRVLEARDSDYGVRLLQEINWQTPGFTQKGFSEALDRFVSDAVVFQKLSLDTQQTVAAMAAEGTAANERFKTALKWAKLVSPQHPRYLQAKFVEALSEYQVGNKVRALEIQQELIQSPRVERSEAEFQGLIALNLARMYFQEGRFTEAHKAFLTITKDHPLWLQGLVEMGWAQLLGGDFEGAIGNMYSIQSPFFKAAYKPESYVIRTIGYMNLCQYGDAYRTLTVLEKEHRVLLDQLDSYLKSQPQTNQAVPFARHETFKKFFAHFNSKDRKTDLDQVDGLSTHLIREVARSRDFLNLQKSLNRQVDEKSKYAVIADELAKNLKSAQNSVTASRKTIAQLRKQLTQKRAVPLTESDRMLLQKKMESEMDILNDRFFAVDLFNEAVSVAKAYKQDVIDGADRRILATRGMIDSTISNKLLKIRTDLSRYLDNNELLRYEVFAASGENLRNLVSGGEKERRVPASVIPKSKRLAWEFDGEYWEDEIGHYRSSLKNNCPASDASRSASAEQSFNSGSQEMQQGGAS